MAALANAIKLKLQAAKAKIAELQTLPEQLPESWEEHIDENGKPYYVDTETGEWYRIESKPNQHKRVDTNEKKEFNEQKNQMDTGDNSSDDTSSQSDSAEHTEESRSVTPVKKQKPNHAEPSAASKGWQCNACLAPHPDTSDDQLFLEKDIGITHRIHRRKLLGEFKKLKANMDSFRESTLFSPIMFEKLSKYGIVTMNMLCQETKQKSDLKHKFGLIDDNQCDLLWNIITLQNKPQNEGM